MDLVRLQVRDFRPFEDVSVDFARTGISFFIGANNSGKSALLSALDIVAGLDSGAHARRSGAEQAAEIGATFALSESDRARLYSGFQLADLWETSEAFSEVEWRFREFRDERMFVHEVRATREGGMMAGIAGIRDFNEATGQGNMVALDLPSWFNTQVPANAYQLANATGGAVLDAISGNLYLPLRELLQEWRAGFYHFHALRSGTQRQRSLQAVETLDPSGASLPEALLYLNTQEEPDWEEIALVIQAIVHDVGDLRTPARGSTVEIAFEDPHLRVRHNLKDLGTGVEQVLMTSYVGVRHPAGGVVVIEEPETNLHPAAQRELLRFLRRWSANRAFIASTHSPVFLDQLSSDTAVWLIERNKGVATVRRAETELPDVLAAIGVRLSDVLSAERIIFVEGEADAEVLRQWFPEMLVTGRAVVLPLGGGDKVWQAGLIDSVFSAADEIGRPILLIRDRDELDEAAHVKLTEAGLVHILARRELENYFLDPVAIHGFLSSVGVERGWAEPPTSGELELSLRSAADELRQITILKLVAAQIAVVRLVDRELVTQLGAASVKSSEVV